MNSCRCRWGRSRRSVYPGESEHRCSAGCCGGHRQLPAIPGWRGILRVRVASASSASIRRFVGMGIAFLAAQIGSGERNLPAKRPAWASPGRRFDRRACRPPAQSRTRSHCRQSLRDRARPRSACCPGRAACAGLTAGVDCRADAGRSSVRPSTYSTPHRPLPSWLARRIRCASPLDSVAAPRPASGTPTPRRSGTARRFLISRSSSPAILRSRAFSFQPLIVRLQVRPAAAGTDRRSSRSEDRTAAASSRRRLPPHTEHSTSSTRCSSRVAKRGRQPRGFFQGGIESLELKAEQRSRSRPWRCRQAKRRTTARPCRA